MNKARDPGTTSFDWRYSAAEIWADGVVHTVGIVLATAGATCLVAALAWRSATSPLAVAIYLTTLLLSVGMSAAYNLWPVTPAKWVLRRFDHSAIYLLIAGTYTPFMVKLGTWWLLAAVWAIATLGVVLKLLRPGRFDRLSIALCLALGWSGLMVADKMLAELPAASLWLIGLGGVAYSTGVLFHVWEKLRFQNAIWHGFVVAGSSLFFGAVWSTVTT